LSFPAEFLNMASNDGDNPIAIVYGNSDDERAALDQLGPLTRHALCYAPIRYAALGILQQIKDLEAQIRLQYPPELRDRVILNPCEPRLDRAIADGLKQDSLKVLKQDRSDRDAELGVTPIEAKITVKSIREQRRSARRIRW
jgi:hypothetical protein